MSIKITSTPAYKRLKSLVDSCRAKTDVATLVAEARNIQAIRPVRALQVRHKTSKIIEANLADQSYRSRLVEILMGIQEATSNLDVALSITADKLLIDNSKALTSEGYRTQTERVKYVKNRLSFVQERISEIEVLADMCRLVIEDIDQAGWVMKRVIETLDLTRRPDRVL